MNMNAVRERILTWIEPYKEFAEHRDLIAFTVGEEYLSYDYESDTYLEADFSELVAVVEKDWLFEQMKKDNIENPVDYLQNEYTWDDSYDWFLKALVHSKVVMVKFN